MQGCYPREALEIPSVRFFLSNYNNKSIAYIGTSITSGSGSTGGLGYVNVTDSYLRTAPPYYDLDALVNYGMGGSTSWYGLFKVPDLETLSPDVVSVEYAVNDGNVDFYANTAEALIRRIRTVVPNAKIVFIAFCSFASAVDNVMTNLNAAVLTRWQTICSTYGVTFVNFHQAISDAVAGGDDKTDYMSDTVHPNNGGHALASSILRGQLLSAMSSAYTPTTLPDRLYSSLNMESTPIQRDGTDNDGETGTWSTSNDTWRVSSEADATITYTGSFSSFGLYHAVAGVISWQLDGGDWTEMNLGSYGPYRELSTTVIEKAAHTLVIKVVSGTVTIKEFMAI